MHYAPWTFCILTFGCKVNQYESQSVREAWQRMNGMETDAPAEADVILLNTCAVTANAVTDARQAVRRLQRPYVPAVPYRRIPPGPSRTQGAGRLLARVRLLHCPLDARPGPEPPSEGLPCRNAPPA